jgi:PST family polysaccharide transporter
MAFARILRSSALMGGASVLVLVAAFLRTKAIAWMVGPAGVGLGGVLVAFNGLFAMAAGWGLATAGVRTVAAAAPEEQAAKMAAVRWLGLRLSWLGLLAVAVLFVPIGLRTFHPDDRHILELGLAGLAVPLLVAAGMWGALLQAGGHLRALATTQVLSAFAGVALGLPLVYVCHQAGHSLWGVALGILVATGSPAAFLWWSARRHCPSPAGVAVERTHVQELLRLGGALMVVGLLSQLSAYVARLIVLREFGLTAAGHYQAALAIASSLPGFVFAAMATDFFPRVAAARDEAEARSLVEKQIQAGLLLALPLLAALLTMGRVCIHWLYTADQFEPAIPLLTWMVWGVFFRLVSWPMGFWLQARGSNRTVIVVELISNLILGLLPWVLVGPFGLQGAAIAFAAGYVAYAVLMSVVMRWRTGHWVGLRTWVWAGVAGLALLAAQMSVRAADGDFWGLLPTGLLGVVCAVIYYRSVRSERHAAAEQP